MENVGDMEGVEKLTTTGFLKQLLPFVCVPIYLFFMTVCKGIRLISKYNIFFAKNEIAAH